MRTHHSQHRSKIQKIAGLILLAFALTIVTPVLADYLGPSNRTITESGPCQIILLECMLVTGKGYREHQVDSWSCSNESKPWRSYPSQPPSTGCFKDTDGYKYWEKNETSQQVTYPPATIQGVLQNCTLQNGWCTTAPQLSLSGNEPIPNFTIIGIEGTRNGETFGCPGSTCSVSLQQGNNSFTYWALSSYTDTSLMGTLSAKVDTVKPTISGQITATSGLNNWFTSPVIFKGLASDDNPGSGLAAFTCVLDGIALASCASITVNSEGPHSLVFTARDNAGHTNSLTQNAFLDLQAPALNISLDGTSGSNPDWYTSAHLNGSASDTSSGSGLMALEYRLDQDNWAPFPASGELPLPEGRHTIKVRATDNAGLTASSEKTFSLDSNPPSIAIEAAGTRGANNWYITNLSLTASASDEISGIGGLEYSLNNDSWLPYTSSLDLTDGIHEISFWATDEAGLASQVNQTYQIDTHLPGIEGSLSGITGENGWFTLNVTLSASALDPQPGSGIDAFTYTLNGSPEEPYALPLNLPDGRHTIQLTGLLAWLYWAAELGLVLYIARGGVKDYGKAPYCEACGKRLGRERHLGGTVPANEPLLLDMLGRHDLAGLGELLVKEAGLPSVELYLRKCDACGGSASFLTVRRASLGRSGVVLSDISKATLPPQESTLFMQQLSFEVD